MFQGNFYPPFDQQVTYLGQGHGPASDLRQANEPEAGYLPAYPVPVYQAMPRQQLIMEEAIQIARGQVSGTVVEAELEREHGRLIFSVDIVTAEGMRYEVEIDAMTGEVLDLSLD